MKKTTERIKAVESSPLARGRKEYLKYLDGEKITARQAILAKCYECIGYAIDGKYDCKMPLCSLYPFMPFREGEKYKSRTMSEEQKKAAGKRLKKARLTA